jgi:allantoinase
MPKAAPRLWKSASRFSKDGKPVKLPAHSRYDYVPIHKRPQYEWPEGARLAVTFCNNIEFFAFGAGLGVDPSGSPAPQSHRNYAWRDYGNRVGLWHYLDVLDEFALPGAHNVNSAVLEHCPDIVERLNGRGDEYVGHGRTNAERQDGLWEEDEARLIAECTEIVTRLSGRRPEGWLGPGLAESGATPDLLKEAGYRYVMDWAVDDQPIWMRTRAGPLLSVPYPAELNDLPALVNRRHTGRQFAEMIIDQFDEMLAQSRKYPLVFAVAVHPFIIGQPFRLRPFRDALRHIMHQRDDLWITTPGEISRYCESLPKGTVPGSD